MNNFQELSIEANESILSALKLMDQLNRKLIIIVENDFFFSLLSIGDIQRAILANTDLSSSIKSIIRKKVKVAHVDDDLDSVKKRMLERRNEFMPVISSEKRILDVIFWQDLIKNEKQIEQFVEPIPVVIMAGGKGSRLKPLTNILPKPLIPMNEKTMIEEIMTKFVDVGCNKFYISLNYKAEMIKQYFKELNNEKCNIEYLNENKPLGTAGSLYLLKGKIRETFFVSNCDIIIDQDIHELYNYHKSNNNSITIVSALKHYKIPYGTIQTGKNGQLLELSEKPELTFQINSGIYILEPEMLNEIPDNTFYHITDLIEQAKYLGHSIGVFPVSEGSWKDIGDWDEYIKNVLDVKR